MKEYTLAEILTDYLDDLKEGKVFCHDGHAKVYLYHGVVRYTDSRGVHYGGAGLPLKGYTIETEYSLAFKAGYKEGYLKAHEVGYKKALADHDIRPDC